MASHYVKTTNSNESKIFIQAQKIKAFEMICIYEQQEVGT